MTFILIVIAVWLGVNLLVAATLELGSRPRWGSRLTRILSR
ncbi:MAG: hypothetical protein QOG62_1889 [Thermoleophilaceae bacterium]|jgi:hypothetical protein|nr:hypothetical protein [Thermoleophilaceae bacterium]